MRANAARILALLFILSIGQCAIASAQEPAGKTNRAAYDAAVSNAIEFLRTSQAADGSFSGKAGPGFTAVVTTAVLHQGRGADDPLVAKSLNHLLGFMQPDGGIYASGSHIKTYETALGLMCLAAANRDGRYDSQIAEAEKFLKGGQFGASDGAGRGDVNYGGAGHGGETRPDLPNTVFLLDALQAAGRDANDEAVQRALVFVSRCQNLETENNTTQFAAKVNDGGFYYSPAGEGSSPAGKTNNGGLRSYGSMT